MSEVQPQVSQDLIFQILQQKAQRDPLLAATLEAAIWQAAFLGQQQSAAQQGEAGPVEEPTTPDKE